MQEIEQEQSNRLHKLFAQGRLLRQQDRVAAIKSLEQCLELIEASGTNHLLVDVLTELALALTGTEQKPALHRAKSLLLRAEALLPKKQEPTTAIAYLLYCRGVLHLKQRNFVDGLVHLSSAYHAYANDLDGLCKTDDALGEYYAALGDFQAALFHLDRSRLQRQTRATDIATDLPTERDPNRDISISYAYLAKLHLQMGQYDQAEHYFQQSLEIANQCEDRYLQIAVFTGLGQVALGREQWSTAKTLLSKALQLSRFPADLVSIAGLHLNLAESLLGEKRYVEAQQYIEVYAFTYFQSLDDRLGIAAVNRTRGRILIYRLRDGIDRMELESIEAAEDFLIEASLTFEQHSMPQEYARTLYDMAYLYRICSDSSHKYQYQGKALRALEIALSILERLGHGAPNLIFQIEILLHQVDQTVWLERAVSRLRGLKQLGETRAIAGKYEEVTLLATNLCDYSAFMLLEPDTAMRLLNTYLRYMSEVVQRYRGIISHFAGDGLVVIFRTLRSESGASTAYNSASATLQNDLQPTLRATLAAQEMLVALQAFNQEASHHHVQPQQIQIGIATGNAVIGNIGNLASTGFTAVGAVVKLASQLCHAASPGEIRLCQQTYAMLSKVLYHRAIATTETLEQLKLNGINSIGNTMTYRLDELSYYSYSEPTNKSWLFSAKSPALLRLKLPLHVDLFTGEVTEITEVITAATIAVVNKLNLNLTKRSLLSQATTEIFKVLCRHALTHPELVLLFLPEESCLEILFSLEAMDRDELQNTKDGCEQLCIDLDFSVAQLSGYSIEVTSHSLSIRIFQNYQDSLS